MYSHNDRVDVYHCNINLQEASKPILNYLCFPELAKTHLKYWTGTKRKRPRLLRDTVCLYFLFNTFFFICSFQKENKNPTKTKKEKLKCNVLFFFKALTNKFTSSRKHADLAIYRQTGRSVSHRPPCHTTTFLLVFFFPGIRFQYIFTSRVNRNKIVNYTENCS